MTALACKAMHESISGAHSRCMKSAGHDGDHVSRRADGSYVTWEVAR